jgi:TPR repeat protein
LLRNAADEGDAPAQIYVGSLYLGGDGVPKDEVEAFRCFRKAADHGSAEAQNDIGIMFANGYAVQKDETEALAWYMTAAASGDEGAVRNRNDSEIRLGPEITLAAQRRSQEIHKEVETVKAKQVGSGTDGSSRSEFDQAAGL